MRRILFVVDRVNAKNDSNINLVKNLTQYLEKENSVFLLGHDITKDCRSDFCFYYRYDEDVRNLYFSLSDKGNIEKALLLISHPLLSFLGLFKFINFDLIEIPYKYYIKKCIKKYRIDTVISVSAPFYTSKAVSKLNDGCKKIIYMFDPYKNHYLYKNKRTEKQEKNAFSKVDAVLIPKLLKADYPDHKKIISTEFPNLIINEKRYVEKNRENEINLVYVGSLYAGIRSPEYLYRLLKRIDDKKIRLTIVGKVYGEFPKEFYNEFSDFISTNVVFTGPVSKEEALNYLNSADVLVNIGNKIENMLPSKIFELIATGKPVLNITQLENCPTLSYFNRYNNALSINSAEEINNAVINKTVRFLNNKNEIDSNDIYEKFIEATPKFVANQLIETIERVEQLTNERKTHEIH